LETYFGLLSLDEFRFVTVEVRAFPPLR